MCEREMCGMSSCNWFCTCRQSAPIAKTPTRNQGSIWTPCANASPAGLKLAFASSDQLLKLILFILRASSQLQALRWDTRFHQGQQAHYQQFLDDQVPAEMLIMQAPCVLEEPGSGTLAPSLGSPRGNDTRPGEMGPCARARTMASCPHPAQIPRLILERCSGSRSRRRRSVPRMSTSFLQSPCACGVRTCTWAA